MAPARSRAALLRRPLILVLAAVLVVLAAPVPSAVAAPHSAPASGTATATSTPSPTAAATSAPTSTPTPTSTPSPAASTTAGTPSPAAEASSTAPAAVTAAAPPTLAVSVTAAPSPITVAGQTVTYTVTVRNAGGGPAADLAVTAVATNLHAPTCTPTAQGGTLATGATTTCTGSRTSTQAELWTHGGTVTATATAFAPDGTAVTGTATGKVPATSAPPHATDDVVSTTFGRSVVVPASTNDTPAVAGGPVINPSRTVFKQLFYPEVNPDTKSAESDHGEWYVRADGSVLFVPLADNRTAGTDTLPYRVFDSAGHSSVANLTVIVRPGVQAVPDAVRTPQGREVVVHPLGNDHPGQRADGSPAAWVASPLRFSDAQPMGDAKVSGGGTELDIPFTGHLEAYADQIDFRPVASFTGTLSVGYSATDTVGNTGSSTIDLTVAPQVPTARDLSATTGLAGAPDLAAFRWRDVDTSGQTGVRVDFDGFAARDDTPLGTYVETPQGTWFFRTNEDVPEALYFEANPTFTGTTSIGYTLVDDNGTRATARLTVTVPPGGVTRPDLLVSLRGADAKVDPGANDTASPRADGKPGSFDPRFAVFPTAGQPAGSVVADYGKTLTVPGRGKLWFTDGTVTFRPQRGFTGDGGTVAYALEERGPSGSERGQVDVGTLHLAATGDLPVAVDDTGSTPSGRAVTLPGSTNDDPGILPGPLTTTFPVLGQPAGSVVASDGRSLNVPDEGRWTVASSGAVTFVPVTGFTGGTTTVLYRTTRTDGASATGTLQVQVAPGIVLVPISVVRAQGQPAGVDPLVGARPGYSADGSVGTLDPRSVRFPTTGQPSGATVSDGGRTLAFSRGSASAGFIFRVDDAGLVQVTAPYGYRGRSPKVRFSVQGTVKDATGSTYGQQAASTLVVTVTGRDPTAVDDAVTVTDPQTVITLPAGLDDVPGSASVPIDQYSTSLPYDQLPGLPKGSRIRYVETYIISYWVATVPGEGSWQIDPYTGKAFFDPAEGFVGTTTPLQYEVHDVAGNTAEGTLTVTVRHRPDLTTGAVSGVTRQGVPVTVDLAAGATPGQSDADVPDPGAFFGDPLPSGATIPLESDERTLVVPGEGTYVIGYGSTQVVFSPAKGFVGTTRPVQVRTRSDAATLTIKVSAVTPVARDDAATTARGVPVRVRLLDNDDPGTAARSLVPSSVRLTAAGLPAGSTLASDRQMVALPGRGIFAVAGDGTVTFYPVARFSGAVPTVGYEVADANGTKAPADIAVQVA